MESRAFKFQYPVQLKLAHFFSCKLQIALITGDVVVFVFEFVTGVWSAQFHSCNVVAFYICLIIVICRGRNATHQQSVLLAAFQDAKCQMFSGICIQPPVDTLNLRCVRRIWPWNIAVEHSRPLKHPVMMKLRQL